MGALCIMHFSFNPLMPSYYSYSNGAMISYGKTPLTHPTAFDSSEIMPSIPGINCDAHIKALNEITMSLTSSPPGSTPPSVPNPTKLEIHVLPGAELRQNLTQYIASSMVSERVNYIAPSTIKSNSEICITQEATKIQGTNISTTTLSQPSQFTSSTSRTYTSITFQSVNSPTIVPNKSSLKSSQAIILDHTVTRFTGSSQGGTDSTISDHDASLCYMSAPQVPIDSTCILIWLGLSYVLYIGIRKKCLL